MPSMDTVIADSDEVALFNELVRERLALDNRIGKYAAAIVLAKLDQYKVDEFDLDDENEQPNYAIIDDNEDGDELLDEAVGWLPRMAIYNVRGKGGEPPKARREDLGKLLRGEPLW